MEASTHNILNEDTDCYRYRSSEYGRHTGEWQRWTRIYDLGWVLPPPYPVTVYIDGSYSGLYIIIL